MGAIFTFLDDDPTLATLGAGGGVPSPIKLTTLTLTNAQVISLPTTPVVVIPAPGTGLMNVLLFAVLKSVIVTAYGTVDVYANLNLFYPGVYAGFFITNNADIPSTELSKFLGSGGAGTYITTIAVGGLHPFVVGDGANLSNCTSANTINASISVTVDNLASGVFSGGNAGNSIKISAYYITTTP